MPRRNQPRRAGSAAASSESRTIGATLGSAHRVAAPDGDWLVRTVPGAQAAKIYRCPGCDHEIRAGISHVVAWPAEDHGGVEDRRHWHTGCWNARGRRGPTARRR
ncbi:hypothetical protein [Actinoalloteichus fjordicus]|uniref:hypothetical protein n=1 Tax=Actinoalloteichus TaxID=65496 RepID=UPI00095160B2